MYIEEIRLSENALLVAYIADDMGYKRDGLLIIPGGGYKIISDLREGSSIALDFLGKGLNCFVLKEYSLNENAKFPQPLIEASLAMKHIKDNADRYGIDKERIFAIGFSAGGHLCASLGNMWYIDEIYKEIDMEFGYNKPKGIIPCYPVISGDHPHLGSFQMLTGKESPTKKELDSVSVDNFVSEKSSPAFIMHTANDGVVPVENSLLLAMAYSKNKIPFELHIFPDGTHGIALANEITSNGNADYLKKEVEQWPVLALDWIRRIK